MPFSDSYFDKEIVEYVRRDSRGLMRMLDVGAGAGKYSTLLKQFGTIDAIEIFQRYISEYNLLKKYSEIFCQDVMTFEKFNNYDLVILGDVLEHLSVENSVKILNKIFVSGASVIVVVPYLYAQGECYGNSYEEHLQPDLTTAVMLERYSVLKVLFERQGTGVFVFKEI